MYLKLLWFCPRNSSSIIPWHRARNNLPFSKKNLFLMSFRYLMHSLWIMDDYTINEPHSLETSVCHVRHKLWCHQPYIHIHRKLRFGMLSTTNLVLLSADVVRVVYLTTVWVYRISRGVFPRFMVLLNKILYVLVADLKRNFNVISFDVHWGARYLILLI